jgi:kynurenine formamidase
MHLAKLVALPRLRLVALLASATAAFMPPSPASGQAPASPLWALHATLKSKTWVDLTHSFDTSTPHWKGFTPMTRKTTYTVKKDGFWVEAITHVTQWGTHVDVPAHFHEGKRTTSDIPVTEMLMPLVVLDVHEQVAKNPDYTVTVADVQAWESRHGTIPAGAFVALRTDWAKRWPDQAKMQNVDNKGIAHYPGWSMDVLKLLYEQRKITASGHETTDTDPGSLTSKEQYPLETWLLGTDHYQIELLDNLDKVPEAGALVSVTWPKLQKGPGFPARVFAVLP